MGELLGARESSDFSLCPAKVYPVLSLRYFLVVFNPRGVP